MFDQMITTKKSKQLVSQDPIRFLISKVCEYRQSVKRLDRLILLLKQMTGGLLVRGQESHSTSIPERDLVGTELLYR
jgi:hypothetical protein